MGAASVTTALRVTSVISVSLTTTEVLVSLVLIAVSMVFVTTALKTMEHAHVTKALPLTRVVLNARLASLGLIAHPVLVAYMAPVTTAVTALVLVCVETDILVIYAMNATWAISPSVQAAGSVHRGMFLCVRTIANYMPAIFSSFKLY